MNPIDHDRCSELLPSYVRGDLRPVDSEAVAGHLADCAQCTKEHRALVALLEGEEPGLDHEERQWLHRSVRAALADRAPLPESQALQRRARFGELMGAAAVVALLAVGGVWLATQDEDGADFGTTAEKEAAEAPAADAAARALLDGTVFFDRDAGVVDKQDLLALGRRGFSTGSRGRTSVALQVEGDEERAEQEAAGTAAGAGSGDAVNELANAAPSGAELVRRCAQVVVANQPYRIAPVYGAFGKLLRDDRKVKVLVLGFRFSSESSGALDRFMVWVWPRGSCGIPLHVLQDDIRS